ncbi:ATP-binding protein [Rhizobium sp. SL86]|uniref:ATP-binding protein n=1 Tax=Rhizobium sp. SL86 TaxID=2995148 RepID=UPI002274CD55|nr:winged helix-turn-helix domain-containing protein [Rhizobium sp. SL86]MCY1666463.1 winged helix-turn-helix domain-containing protein [Rhizobium sp. SL86]
MTQTPPVRIALSDRLTLSPVERALYQDGERLKVGARALEILLVLAEEPGRLVSKDELMERVWPSQHVDEAALRVHLSALRRLLTSDDDHRLIVNESGRGYRLVPPAITEPQGRNLPLDLQSLLPAPVTSVIGREDLIDRCVELTYGCRLVSLCGTGGIGKTTIALVAAHRISAERSMRAVFLNLSSITDSSCIRAALAAQMGLIPAEMQENSVLSAVGSEPLLLVLDNCEHVIDAAAAFAEELLGLWPRLIMLTTSREPLRASGEWVLRVPPLDLPAEGSDMPEDAGLSPAVQLFMQRAGAVRADFCQSEDDFRHIVHICRRLDGIPLAIEMAATRLSAYSLQELDRLLVDRFSALITGRRTALPRHRTLLATLDWSYGLLTEAERDVFRRVSIFRSVFSMDAAISIAQHERLSDCDVMEALSSLVAKSLVLAERRGDETRYRMLETIRSYAARHLKADGAFNESSRNHAYHVLTCAGGNLPVEETGCRPALLKELRAALTWATGPTGDSGIAEDLVAAAPRLLSRLAMPVELVDIRGCQHPGDIGPPGPVKPCRRRGPVVARGGSRPARGEPDPSTRLFEPRLILADLG